MFRLRDSNAAEDAVQETLLSALEAHDRYQGSSSERTWLVGILKHKIMDHYRRIGRSREVFAEDLKEDNFNPFEASGEWVGHWRADMAPSEWHLDAAGTLEKKEFWVTLNRCLSELPERMALVFTMREIDGLSTAEICDALQLSESNLWVLLHRARMRLRHSLEAEWVRGEPPQAKRTSLTSAERARSTAMTGLESAFKLVRGCLGMSVRFPEVFRLIGWSE